MAAPVAIASFLMHDIHTGEPFGLATVQRDIRERLASEAALRALGEQREALLTRLVSAQDAERAQIAVDSARRVLDLALASDEWGLRCGQVPARDVRPLRARSLAMCQRVRPRMLASV